MYVLTINMIPSKIYLLITYKLYMFPFWVKYNVTCPLWSKSIQTGQNFVLDQWNVTHPDTIPSPLIKNCFFLQVFI